MDRCTISNAARIAAMLFPMMLVGCGDDDGAGGTGGTGGSGGSSSDAGAGDGVATDSAVASDSNDGRIPIPPDGNRPLPEGSIPPNGTMLARGILALVGVTIDNYAVYVDEVNATLNVVSLTGGMPSVIGSATNRVAIMGSAVLTWTGTASVAPLSAWTAATGMKPISMASYASTSAIAVSPGGTRILYFDDVDDNHNVGNLTIANIDGSGKTLVAPSVDLRDARCAPTLAFGGNSAAAAAFCWGAPEADGGVTDGGRSDDVVADVQSPESGVDGSSLPSAVVQSFSGEGWQVTTLATNVAPRMAVAPTGTSVLVTGPQGLVVYPILGGPGTVIDPEGGFGRFTLDGLNVVYATPSTALKRSTIESPAPVTLVPYGFAGVRAVSPDEKWALVYSTIDTRDLSDLYLTSIAEPGPVTTLSQTATAGLFRSDGFTMDSAYAIYYTDIAAGVGTLNYAAVGGGTPTVWASQVWMHYAASADTIVFNDNYDDVTGTGDIRVARAGQSVSSIIVSLADEDFYISGTRDKVVYSWKYQYGDWSGLWVATVPSF